jgi:hypothetical protein
VKISQAPPLTYPNNEWRDLNANCFSYGINDPYAIGLLTQPGGKYWEKGESACDRIEAAVPGDGFVRPLKQDDCNSVCPPNTHLVYIVVDPEHGYHLFRKNSNEFEGGRWAQIPAKHQAPTHRDDDNQVIICPSVAKHKYAITCGYWCAPNNPFPRRAHPKVITRAEKLIAANVGVVGVAALGAVLHKYVPHNPISKAAKGIHRTIRNAYLGRNRREELPYYESRYRKTA